MSHPVEEILAILLRATQPRVVNCQPRTILESESIFISHTVLDAFGLNVASMAHVVESRAIRLRAVHAIVVNAHQTRTLPSDWRVRV